jgi:hypothetical protein
MGKVLERYQPELHYMRGPGPKWLEKHGQGANNSATPTNSELARAKGWREAVLTRLRELSAAHKQAS